METALLILAGGRPMPNMLTIIHEKPALIVAIVSKDQRASQIPLLQNALMELFQGEEVPKLDVSHEIDAFNLDEVYDHCLLAVEENPGCRWIFNITSGTTIMSIGAYEAARHLVAQGRSVRCWYLDTGHTNLVALFGEGRDDGIFHISVDQYAATYGCRLKSGKISNPDLALRWLPFVHFLINEPDYIDILQNLLSRSGAKGEGPLSDTPKLYPVPKKKAAPLKKTPEWSRLLAEAEQVGLVSNWTERNDEISFELTDVQAHFLNGHWLEAYIWNEVAKLEIFSDHRWDLELFHPELLIKKPSNQIDVSMVYKAQLFIVECKTGDNDLFKKETLNELSSIAQMLGKDYVGKLLVASWSEKFCNGEQQERIERFKERAKYLNIEVATRENLTEIGTIIENLVRKRGRG